MAVAEAGRFIGGNLFDVAEETIPANSSESPRSFGMEGEETMEGDWFHETPDDERSIPLTETPVSGSRGGYPDYDEFESDSDVSGELEGMKGSGDLEGAYAAGKRVEGGAGEVLGAWLEEVETQLAFEKVLRELELHIRREEMWIVCWLS